RNIDNSTAQLRSDESNGVNVRSFGAKGNGITDDSKAINEAIKYLAQSKEYILYFPPGKYLIESQILLRGNKLKIVGESPQTVKLIGADVYNLFNAIGDFTDSLQFKNIFFDGSEVKSSVIKLRGNDVKGSILIANCIFYNAH